MTPSWLLGCAILQYLASHRVRLYFVCELAHANSRNGAERGRIRSRLPDMHDMVRDNWLRFNLPLEGQVHFMYLDVKGWVSTGVGNKIDQTAAELSAPSDAERSASLSLANQLQWTDKNSGAAASPEQVAADWDAVKGRLDLAAKGHRAFEEMTQLRISDEEVFRVVSGKLAEME